MEGMGTFIALIFILIFFALFFTILLVLALGKIRVSWIVAIGAGFVSFLLSLLLFSTDWLFEINIQIILFYTVIVFFSWLLILVSRRNK